MIRQKERKSPRRRGDLIKDKRKCRPGGHRAAQQNPYMRNNPSPVNGISDLRLKMDQVFSVITTFCHRSLKVKVSFDDEIKNLNHNSKCSGFEGKLSVFFFFSDQWSPLAFTRNRASLASDSTTQRSHRCNLLHQLPDRSLPCTCVDHPGPWR